MPIEVYLVITGHIDMEVITIFAFLTGLALHPSIRPSIKKLDPKTLASIVSAIFAVMNNL